ncbi:t-SNARE [Pseudocohnilembus persalinus]|uniref:t-SNARE n=1 Tax=Pseudocohnilembus persalinus TaxID=266149 RepID=A0A0V0QEB3_PSEPJ|nr:t-SNARE [Pseudocohnilembus persalinus]|eukprot:KRX00551.1 t-SNARE [Pseudocohnilembus persalinus]
MNDLYYELQDIYNNNNGGVRLSQMSSARNSVQQEDLMAEFRMNSERVRIIIRMIEQNNNEIAELRQLMIHSTSSAKEKEINGKLQELANDNVRHTQNMKSLMEAIEADIKKSEQEYPGETETLAKQYQKRALAAEVSKLLQESQTIHSEYKQSAKNKIERQIQILDPNLSHAKRQELMEDPDGLQKVMQMQTLGTASLQIRHRVDDIVEKAREVQKLERTMEQCYQMMTEIAFLVSTQGEMLDDIEANLDGAKNYIQKAAKVMEKEKKVHQKARKKMCCIIFLGLAIILLITSPLWIKLLRNWLT